MESVNLAQQISVQQVFDIDTVKALFEMRVDKEELETYRLPVQDSNTKVIVGLSGGADSSVLALFAAAYLAPNYPNLEFVFNDTKAEPASCYETLSKIEDVTGIPVTRLVPEKGLFEKIDDYNGFLPSGKARWCTREMKIEPLMDYMKQIPSDTGYINLAGIRYDESNRDGISFQYSMEMNAKAAFPFIELKIDKTTVFDILDRSIGIPDTYKYRSRSGCFNCFFQRNAEAIGMLLNDPDNYEVTEKCEKLSSSDEDRWEDIPPTLSEMGIGALYPVPAFIDMRKPDRIPLPVPKKLKSKEIEGQGDLFSHDESEFLKDTCFAAFAVYVDERLGQFGHAEYTPGTYWQELITVSPSLTGMKSALNNHYKFRKTTPMPHYDLEDMKVVIAQIDFPYGTLDMAPPAKESFTWKSTTAFKQLRHVVRHCQQALNKADVLRRYEDSKSILHEVKHTAIANGHPVDMNKALDAAANKRELEAQVKLLPAETGSVVWEGLYVPSPDTEKEVQMQLEGISVNTEIKVAKEDLEHDDVPMACVACSI